MAPYIFADPDPPGAVIAYVAAADVWPTRCRPERSGPRLSDDHELGADRTRPRANDHRRHLQYLRSDHRCFARDDADRGNHAASRRPATLPLRVDCRPHRTKA